MGDDYHLGTLMVNWLSTFPLQLMQWPPPLHEQLLPLISRLFVEIELVKTEMRALCAQDRPLQFFASCRRCVHPPQIHDRLQRPNV